MEYLSVQIVRFVDEYQPGIVACDFLDAAGHCNTIIAEVPLVSMKDLDAGSTYPRPGGVGMKSPRDGEIRIIVNWFASVPTNPGVLSP